MKQRIGIKKCSNIVAVFFTTILLLTSCSSDKTTKDVTEDITPSSAMEETSGTTKGEAEAMLYLENASEEVKRSLVSSGNNHRVKKLIEKMRRGEETTLAFLGGSITEGYLVNTKQNFVIKTTNYLKDRFQNETLNRVNAGLSGTSSTIGLLRAKQDILSSKPDLIVIEFAVNDANDTISKMAYESLVKECLIAEGEPAVLLLFTVTKTGYTCEEQMTKVGMAYNLPMISVDQAIAPEMEAGTMVWEDYSKDDAHPTSEGHTRIADYISYYFETVLSQGSVDEAVDYSTIHAYGAAYEGMNFYNNTTLYPSELGGFVEGNSNITHFPNGWVWNKEDVGSMKFTLKGRNLFLLYKEDNNENLGSLEVYIDGELAKKVTGNIASGWNNPNVVPVLNAIDEGVHEIELRISQDSLSKNFHILGLGTTGELIGSERVIPELLPYQDRAILDIGNTRRLTLLMERARAGEELTIGFIGGSITMGSGASNNDNCYAKKVVDWWSETFPEATFHFVNAGIGATTSQFACARVFDDLLVRKPDFVVVEFSVNDEGTEKYGETYESLLRTIVSYETEPAVMVLNMVQYNSGNNAQNRHNEVALAYHLPIISMKESIYQEILLGNLTASDVSEDNLHPNDRGHAYAAEIVTHFLTKVAKKEVTATTDYQLPETTKSLLSMNSKRWDNRNTTPLMSGFAADTTKQNGITDVFKNGFVGQQVGDSITFTIEGTSVALQYKKTNKLGAPKAVAIIDGDKTNAIELDGNFPSGWGDWLYLHDLDNLLAPGTHTVEIRIAEAGEKPFYLVSLLSK